jgi:hypothetical protein
MLHSTQTKLCTQTHSLPDPCFYFIDEFLSDRSPVQIPSNAGPVCNCSFSPILLMNFFQTEAPYKSHQTQARFAIVLSAPAAPVVVLSNMPLLSTRDRADALVERTFQVRRFS